MAPADAVYLSHPSSLEHDMGAHPEQPARIVAIERELEALGWLGFERVSSPAVDRQVLELVHPTAYVQALAGLSARGGGRIDLDTAMSAGSFDAALHAAGGAVELVTRLLDGRARTGFSAHRPPGHHAERAQAMGFCLFNNVAVAATFALEELGLERVMILDWDVHHGNGTNDIFHSGAEVLFVSIHQSPLYPGTGAAADVGSGAGTGFTVNLPVPPGSGDEDFCSQVAHVAVPLGRAFSPQLLLVSAGYDAHRDDLLASCTVSEEGFATMTRLVLELGSEVGAPVGLVLEGGYDLRALAASVAASCRVLSAGTTGGDGAGEVPLVARAEAARERVRRHWPELESI
jgi:acetoin utilization deacetylase AcuC-like enzyme